jgi:hypothetical protein
LKKINKRIILHVGLPKTASSAMQTYLNENREKLKNFEFNYPVDEFNSAMPKHQSLVVGLFANNHTFLDNVVADNTSENLILTTEGLTNHLYDFSSESLASFRNITKTYQLSVFLMTRNINSWIKSYYSQAVLNPNVTTVDFYATNLTLEEFSSLPRIRQLTNYSDLIKDVKKAYGAIDVVVGQYETQWFKHFSQSFNLPFENHELEEKINVTPKFWAIEVMRQINAYHLPEGERTLWKSLVHEFCQSKHTILKMAAIADMSLIKNKIDISIIHKLYPIEHPDFYLNQIQINAFEKFVLEKIC